MNIKSNISAEDKTPMLLKAEGDISQRVSPLIQLLSAVAYLGVFGSLVCGFMIIMSAVANESHQLNITSMSMTIIAFAVCLTAVFVLRLLDKTGRKHFQESEKEMLLSSRCANGKVIGVVKYIKHVTYRNEVFDETTWSFKIEYFDDEKDTACTVESDRYLNDISTVLSDDDVMVYIKSDGTFAFDGYKLRKSFEDDYISLKIEEVEQNTEV